MSGARAGSTIADVHQPRTVSALARPLFWIAVPAIFVALPFWLPLYRLDFVSDTLALGLLAVSVSVLWGRCSLLSFGQSVFFGIGAYCVAVIGTRTDDIGWLALVLAMALPGSVALLIGYFLLFGRVRGALFSIVTLPLTVIASSIALAWSSVTNGDTGLLFYPLANLDFAFFSIEFETSVSRYYLVLAICGLATTAAYLLLRSRWGRALDAVAGNEARAESLGFSAPTYLTVAFTSCGALAGLGGGAYALTTQITSAELVGLALATEAVAWAAVGGRGNVYLAVLAVFAVRLLQEAINDSVPQAWPILLGAFFVGVVLLGPKVGSAARWVRRRTRGVAAAGPAPQGRGA